MTFSGKYHYGLGRRKESTARARLYKGKGKIFINEKTLDEYTSSNKKLAYELIQPLELLEQADSYDISIKVSGGGTTGQIDASRLAVSNALASINDDIRSTLKKAGYLKRDPREKERKKYGLRKARKKEQFSKR